MHLFVLGIGRVAFLSIGMNDVCLAMVQVLGRLNPTLSLCEHNDEVPQPLSEYSRADLSLEVTSSDAAPS